MTRARWSAPLLAGALALTSCGGGGGSSEGSPTSRSTTTAPTPTSAPGPAETTTTTAPEPEGDVLGAEAPPAPWAAATGAEVTTSAGAAPGTGATAVPCPGGPPAVGSTQCTAYADEGGPYLGLRATTPEGETTTLFCESGDGAFTPSLSVAAPLKVGGPGIADGEGRFAQAFALEVADGVHWYAVRRPAGEDCPVVWDLGADDGTLAAVSSSGGATYPLATGPACVRLVAEGLVVAPGSADGICA